MNTIFSWRCARYGHFLEVGRCIDCGITPAPLKIADKCATNGCWNRHSTGTSYCIRCINGALGHCNAFTDVEKAEWLALNRSEEAAP